MSALETVVALAFLGLASAPHCAAMCGPLALRGCSNGCSLAVSPTLGYVAGRTTSYLFVGALAGTIGQGVLATVGSPLRVFAAEAIALLLLIEGARLLLPRSSPRGESGAFSGWLAALAGVVPTRGLGLGLATGFLPCGALISAVLLASTAGNALAAAAGMVVFSLASLPGLALPVISMLAFRRASPLGGFAFATRPLAGLSGIALVLLALWVGARPLVAGGHLPWLDQHAACAAGNGDRTHAPASRHDDLELPWESPR